MVGHTLIIGCKSKVQSRKLKVESLWSALAIPFPNSYFPIRICFGFRISPQKALSRA